SRRPRPSDFPKVAATLPVPSPQGSRHTPCAVRSASPPLGGPDYQKTVAAGSSRIVGRLRYKKRLQPAVWRRTISRQRPVPQPVLTFAPLRHTVAPSLYKRGEEAASTGHTCPESKGASVDANKTAGVPS